MAKNVGEMATIECVIKAVDGAKLVDADREAPDANLLHSDGLHVGVEVVQTVDPRPLHLRKHLRAASGVIKVELVKRGITGVYRVYYDLDEVGENMRVWDREVPKRFAQLFERHDFTPRVTAADLRAQQISGIAGVEIEQADDPTFVGVGWSVVTREGETLADIALVSKNAKLARYRQANGEYFG